MRQLKRKWNPLALPLLMLSALALMFCEPGKALDPTVPDPDPVDTGKVAAIRVITAPSSLLPTDSGLVRISVRDSADSLPIKGARLFVSSSQFNILSATGTGVFALDSVPDDGLVNFRIHSATPGTGTVSVRVVSGSKQRSASFTVIVTEKPVAPKVVETFPTSFAVTDTALLSLVVVDSAQEKPLANAVVSLSGSFFTIHKTGSKDTMSVDTTEADGKVAFRLATSSTVAGAGTLQVRVRTAAGIQKLFSYTLTVTEPTGNERPRKMVFTAVRSTLRADGSDSTELRVLVKDDNNNPMGGEKLRFTSSGGLVRGSATTDEWGRASTFLVSERANKTVVVTATLEKTGATAQQTVAFDGVTILISTDKKVLMQNSPNNVIFDLKDGGNVPMSGDSLELTIQGAVKGFSGKTVNGAAETLVVVTDTRGQFRGSFTRDRDGLVIISGRALGARSVDTTKFTTDNLTMRTNAASILGNGSETATVTATLVDGNNNPRNNVELRWTTTFGTFTTKPFSSTGSNGEGQITLRAPQGSGLAIVNVEAYSKPGGDARDLLASGNITIQVRALKVHRLDLKVTPDNIPVKIGESKLIAKAYDSADNVMTGVLVGFRLVKGAGGGDEVISPPIDYTKSGTAEAVLKAGGVISLYRGVKLAAVALDISGGDTLVIASSDTVGLTVSGPPQRVSVGVNIEKGLNPEDGTFGLPTAAVVTDVNGNLVADGTPVNFSTTPIGLIYYGVSWHLIDDWPYYFIGDTVFYELPWTDYNDNGKLDVGEAASAHNPSKPARGEDRDGNGRVNLPPEDFDDLDNDGVWDSVNAEPLIASPPLDTTGRTHFVDFNKDGVRDLFEPFNDVNGDGKCQCTGTRDASGALYERQYYGSEANHPFPGEVSVGIAKTVPTGAGKATTAVIYVQSIATFVKVRITAESNGVRSSVDAILPKVKSEE